jgi:hypothetical protein
MLEYLSRSSQCQTQNEFNRLHIELENELSPLEVASIAKLTDTHDLPKFSREWLDKIGRLHPDVLDNPRQFRRHAISPYVNFYQDGDGSQQEKSLLVGFTGNARRLMLPAAIFLQFLEPRCWDMVVLRKCGRNTYLRGLEGVATDLAGIVQYVRDSVPVAGYRRIVTFGTSGGGYAAAWAAILFNAARGICVGGSVPKFPADSVNVPRRYQPSPAPHGVDLEFVYGMDFLRDKQSALALQTLFGGRMHPVAGVEHHNVLAALLAHGEVSGFLSEVLA